MKIKPCPICKGSVDVHGMFSRKDGVDYSKYQDEYGFWKAIPPLKESTLKYYCTCEKRCISSVIPDLVVGEIYDTEEEAIKAWNTLAERLEDNYKKKRNGKEELKGLYDKITKSTTPCTLTALKSTCELIAKYCSMLATVEHDEIKGWYNGQASAYKKIAEWAEYIISIKDTI